MVLNKVCKYSSLKSRLSIAIVTISIFAMMAAPLSATSPIQLVLAEKPDDVGKPDFVISVDKVKGKKLVKLPDGRIAERITHIFYVEEHAKPDDKGKPPKDPKPPKGENGDKGGKICYDIIWDGWNWKTAEPYTYDSSINSNIFSQSITTWEDEVGEIFGQGSLGAVNKAIVGEDVNSVNEVFFEQVDQSGVIAVTFVWRLLDTQKLLEWDMVFNQALSWSYNGAPNSFDFQNIATHEIGHAAGLDHPSNGCKQETMYAFASTGETKKRDLNSGDIAGIQLMYS